MFMAPIKKGTSNSTIRRRGVFRLVQSLERRQADAECFCSLLWAHGERANCLVAVTVALEGLRIHVAPCGPCGPLDVLGSPP